MNTKFCTKCHKKYPATREFFYVDKRTKDGLYVQCKKCHIEVSIKCHQKYVKKYHQRNAKYAKNYYNTITGYLRQVFNNIKQRCNNPKAKDYPRYGGRGIKCLFLPDEFVNYVKSDLQIDPRSLQIHRIDNDKHYKKGNIEFLTKVKHGQLHKGLTGRPSFRKEKKWQKY